MKKVPLEEDKAQQVVDDINNAFAVYAIKEIDFMFTTTAPFVVYMENVLGLSMPILKPLYLYCYTKLLNKASLSKDDIMNFSRCLLLVKGDQIIAYNLRKAVIIGKKDLINEEIQLLSVIFTKHPKSPAAWEHRRWCYQQKLQLIQRVVLLPMEIETERELSRQMAERYPKNYYAWLHRKWLLQYLSFDQVILECVFVCLCSLRSLPKIRKNPKKC